MLGDLNKQAKQTSQTLTSYERGSMSAHDVEPAGKVGVRSSQGDPTAEPLAKPSWYCQAGSSTVKLLCIAATLSGVQVVPVASPSQRKADGEWERMERSNAIIRG